MRRALKGKLPEMRKIEGLNAIEEAVKRATEMGKPVQYTFGAARAGAFRGSESGASFVAALSLLSYVARLTAKFKTRLLVTIPQPDVIPLADDAIRTSYLIEGVPAQYDSIDTLRFFSTDQFAYAIGAIELLTKERPAANFLFGPLLAEALMVAETGNAIGAFQISGTASSSQLPFVVTCTDYTMITEEFYAAGAYLSNDPGQKGVIVGQDLFRLFLMAVIIVNAISITLGSLWLSNFIKL